MGISDDLTAPFGVNEVRFKPQSVKGNRALAIAYIDARLVMDRLDDVLGVENWMDEYEILNDGSVMCRLKLKLNGEWVTKSDVGSPSEQPDGGDRLKAAFSDALKRAAIKFGIGRYLYRLPAVWCDYDPQKKQFTQQPQLPHWALPAKQPKKQPPPNPYGEPQDAPAVPPPAPKKDAPKPAADVGELWLRMSGKLAPADAKELADWVLHADKGLVRLAGTAEGELTHSVRAFLKLADGASLLTTPKDALVPAWNHARECVKQYEPKPVAAA